MPDSDPKLTIRPSPAGTMAVNAARQHRNVPVRLTPSVWSHIADVVPANGAGVSTPAAQTSAPSWPRPAAAANRRPTAASSLTSAGTGVAWPPASLIRPATRSSARPSRAASTTCASRLSSRSSRPSACLRQAARESPAVFGTASAAAPTSSGRTRKPVTPSMITSLSPPRRNATTGVPHACASAAAIPKGSSQRAGYSTTAAPAMASHSEARGTPG